MQHASEFFARIEKGFEKSTVEILEAKQTVNPSVVYERSSCSNIIGD